MQQRVTAANLGRIRMGQSTATVAGLLRVHVRCSNSDSRPRHFNFQTAFIVFSLTLRLLAPLVLCTFSLLPLVS